MKAFAATLLIFVCATLAASQEKPAAAERAPGLYATLDTSMGKIVIQLFEKEAPKTVANFVELATGKKAWRDYKTRQMVSGKPLYDGVLFHRVMPNFMIQAGAHLADGGARIAANIPDEFHPALRHDRAGRVSMANLGEPDTGNSQFFITHRATPHLDDKHAVFGQVVEGQDVVVAIGNVARDANDRPRQPVVLRKVTIERVGPAPAPQAKP